jgi:hypothetical protein
MKALSLFHPFVEPEVMGCPSPVIDHHLRLAMREFCDRTKAWSEWLDPVTLTGTTDTFDYDLTQSQELVAVRRAILNDADIDVMDGGATPEDWNASDAGSDLDPQLVHFDNAQYKIFPIPSSGDVLVVQMAFRPSLAATQVGDILYTRFAEKVADGAKARLMAMVGQEWANPALQVFYNQRFETACHTAANEDFARGKRRTKPSPM